nr:PREDICTED: regulating synaptic membrane exocytosis protein 1 isoform X2 [Bemisia tabaci]
MIPTNVMSFMKKMVTNEGGTTGADQTGDTTLSKLRQTLSSSLMTAQDKVTKLNTSSRPADLPVSSPDDKTQTPTQEATEETASTSSSSTAPPAKEMGSKEGVCRVCLKVFKREDIQMICCECNLKVCEDCASYSELRENVEKNTWRCSVCKMKIQNRTQPILTQDSTDSNLGVPCVDTLQRRHSDVKIGSSSSGGAGGLGSGLAPPRSPELRRHSDVSPASLKELEKTVLKVNRERELQQWGPKGLGGNSPSIERRGLPGDLRQQPKTSQMNLGGVYFADNEMEGEDGDDPESRWRRGGDRVMQKTRRKSRVQKQHSYDDEVKNNSTPGAATIGNDIGLGLPAQLPRRASAYDVYQAGGIMGRMDPERRRSSFRVPTAVEAEELANAAHMQSTDPSSLGLDEERKTRRRGSQLPDLAAIKAGLPQALSRSSNPARSSGPDEEAIRRQASVSAAEDIKIVIHDVDCDQRSNSKRRLVLRRDPADHTRRTRGFGMRVVGGKMGSDGRLFAYIVWTVPGGPAEKAGLQQGDKVLEWNNVALTDRSFEEVCAVMDRTGDVVELLVEHGADLRMCDLLDEPMPASQRKNSGYNMQGLTLENEADKSLASPTRRKLPKTPEQLAKEKQVSGRIQLQVWYHDEKNELVVSILAADDLAPREEGNFGSAPEAYVQLRVLPITGEQNAVKTEVAEPSQNPIWNTTLELSNVTGEQLMDKMVEVTLWDHRPDKEQVFLGECTVDLQKALLDDRPVWYRLEDPRQIRSGRSPRGSLVSEVTQRLINRNNRSISEDRDSEDLGDGYSFLHPDHAYAGNSRRGSSQSEQLEVETYQLNKDFSRSLPGSRRSSFQSAQEKENDLPPSSYVSKSRRRSSCTPRQDPDEILRNLKAVKGELLGRSMSICGGDKRPYRRGRDGKVRKSSCVAEMSETASRMNDYSDDDDRNQLDLINLGPGQILPRGYRAFCDGNLRLKLGLLMTKGQLEVEVVCASGIESEDNPPDTYVKTYLRDNDRWLQKRKTRVVRHSCEPQYRQTLKYSACDVLGRTLLVMLWERQKGFEHNQGLGGAEVSLDQLKLTQLTQGWYPLFPIQTLGSDSNDSP